MNAVSAGLGDMRKVVDDTDTEFNQVG